MRMNLLGMFPFTAPYLAWVFLILSAVLGSPLETDLVGATLCTNFNFVCWCERCSCLCEKLARSSTPAFPRQT